MRDEIFRFDETFQPFITYLMLWLAVGLLLLAGLVMVMKW